MLTAARIKSGILCAMLMIPAGDVQTLDFRQRQFVLAQQHTVVDGDTRLVDQRAVDASFTFAELTRRREFDHDRRRARLLRTLKGIKTIDLRACRFGQSH